MNNCNEYCAKQMPDLNSAEIQADSENIRQQNAGTISFWMACFEHIGLN
jgi:hypothetical protein